MAQGGAYVQQTPIFNFNDNDVNSVAFQDYMTQLTQSINNMALVVNMKDTGYYDTTSYISGRFWYRVPDPNGVLPPEYRPSLRQVYPFALQNGTINPVQTIPHGLTFGPQFMIVDQWGVANWPSNGSIKLPYLSISGTSAFIEVDVNATDIVITTQSDYSDFTNCFYVLEYVNSNTNYY